jgi:PAS domain S-box-containing protein
MARDGQSAGANRRSTQFQTAGWLIAGALTAGALLLRWPLVAGSVSPGTLLAVTVVALGAHLVEIPTQSLTADRRSHDMMAFNEAALLLLLLALPPGWAWVVMVSTYGVANVVLNPGALRNAFNIGSWASTVGVAVFVFEALAAGPSPTALTIRTVGAATVAIAVHMAINYLAVEAVVASHTGVDVRLGLRSNLALAVMTFVGNVALGATAAALWVVDPWLVSVTAVIVLLLRRAYRQVVLVDEVADAVRVERDRLEQVVDGTTDGIVLLDHRGCVAVWNPRMVAWTGVSREEAVGRPIEEVLAGSIRRGDGSDLPAPVAREAIVDSGPVRLQLVHRSGEARVVEVSLGRQQDRRGRPAAETLQLRDMTREQEVARLKDDFLARISHELRTPLTAILGAARTLQAHRDRLEPPLRSQLEERIVARSEQLSHLVDDLLLVAADGAMTGRAGHDHSHCDLAALVHELAASEQERHPGRRIEVTVATPVHASVHEDWLRTVVHELLANAIAYSPDDSSVTIEVDVDEDAVLRVVDHGRGIPTSKLDVVFERFTRLEDPLLMETGGMGLGLFIVDRLVTQLGGRVAVESVVGEGSTFTVRLPLRAPERTEHGERAAAPDVAA